LITLSLLCLLLHVACLVLLKFKLWDRCAGRLETQCCPCLAGKRSGGENDGAGEDNAGTGSGGAAPSQAPAVGQSRPPRRSLGDASMRRMLLRKVASRKATRLEDLAQVHILAHTQKIKARQIDARARLQRRILKARSSAATVTEMRKGKGTAETVKQAPAHVSIKEDDENGSGNEADHVDERPQPAVDGPPVPPVVVVPVLAATETPPPLPSKKKKKKMMKKKKTTTTTMKMPIDARQKRQERKRRGKTKGTTGPTPSSAASPIAKKKKKKQMPTRG